MSAVSIFTLLTMTVKRLILALQILLAGSLYVNGMPAYPKKMPVNVGNGIVYIRLFGDEHNKRAETLDGYTLIQKSGAPGFFRGTPLTAS